jgi:hypothetical protein
MKHVSELSLNLALLIFVGVFFIFSLSLSPVGRFLPLPMALITLLLLLFEAVGRVWEARTKGLDQTPGFPAAQEKKRSEGVVIVWLTGYAAAILALGLVWASMLWVTFYLHFMARKSWRTSFLAGVALGIAVYAPFSLLLDISIYPGEVWLWIAG